MQPVEQGANTVSRDLPGGPEDLSVPNKEANSEIGAKRSWLESYWESQGDQMVTRQGRQPQSLGPTVIQPNAQKRQ